MALDLNAISVDDSTLAAPTISQLTTSAIEGTGVFDKLMGTVKLHLTEEYEAGRITGEEYTTVYLGALTSVMQQSVAYLLNQKQEEEITARIGLIRQQTVTELAQTSDTLPAGLGFNTEVTVDGVVALQKTKLTADTALVTKEGTLKDQQILNLTAEALKIAAEKSKIDKEVLVLAEQIINLTAEKFKIDEETDLLQQQDLNLISENLKITQETAMLLQQTTNLGVEKTILDEKVTEAGFATDVMAQKVATEIAQTSDLKNTGNGLMSGTAITGIAGATVTKLEEEVAKMTAEKVLLSQKSITELAQTSDDIPTNVGALNENAILDGVIKSQKALIEAQTTGFARDAEQKLAKIAADILAVNISVTASDVVNSGFTNLEIGEIMAIAKAGITT